MVATSEKWTSCHKFGGTSVANANCYRQVASLVQEDHKEKGGRTALVVSAMAKVTDALIRALNLARDGIEYTSALQELKVKHQEAIKDLLPKDNSSLLETLDKDSKDIEDILRAVYLSRTYSEKTLELVSGFGEVWSARLLGNYLKSLGLKAEWLDARTTLVVEEDGLRPVVMWSESGENLNKFLSDKDCDYLVITGYIARTPTGIPTTLKRNGSDFSGSIFGALLNSDSIIIWTDVDGVFSADPRRVPEAVMLSEMSYNEAAELAYFGAKVLHPHTMAPAIQKGIPIFIRNTFNASCPGTKIYATSKTGVVANGLSTKQAAGYIVKGFTTMDGISMVNVEGTGLIGVPGCAQRVFGALREVGISVILIAQSSSEHSICFAVPEASGELAKSTLDKTFYREIRHGLIQTVELVGNCSILAVVGDSMSHLPGVSAKFFGALGKAAVNVRATAQGSSERNISVVIDRADSTRALRAAHARFFMSGVVISVGLVGAGLIGGTLLAQLYEQAPVLKKQHGVDIRVRGIIDIGTMRLDSESILSRDDWTEGANCKSAIPADLNSFVDHVHSDSIIGSTVLVDCTASAFIADKYPEWLAKGISISTPNKKAFSSSMALYRQIYAISRQAGAYLGNECTVGAALPVLGPLRDLTLNGDKVKRIEGVLSGTLSFIFNTFSSASAEQTNKRFSEIVREAKERGYTEPDPREDLSGADVARKVTILARTTGMEVEMSDLNVFNLVPEELRDQKAVTIQQFLEGLAKHDEEMGKLLGEARKEGQVLRYVGVVDAENGKASVEMKKYPASSPLATLNGADNMIAITTARYTPEQPLVIRGPGAGAPVTAGGVFADILKIAANLGALL